MSHRFLHVALVAMSTLVLSACGGGGGGSSSGGGGGSLPSATPTPAPGGISTTTLSISPSGGVQVNAGQTTQSFTLSSTTPGLAGPTANAVSCSNLVTVSGGGALPATYTVTYVSGANGMCSLIFDIGNNSITYPIVAGTNNNGGSYPAALTPAPTSLNFTAAGAAAQSVTVTASGGTGQGAITVDGSSCAGIATVTGSGGVPPQTATVTPTGAGSCSVVFVDGEVSTIVPVGVGTTATPVTLSLAPSSVTFTSPTAGTQTVAVNYTGNVGPVSFNTSSCVSANIANFTIPNGSANGASGTLGNGTVTPLGATGTCTIPFSSPSGATASLSITVQ